MYFRQEYTVCKHREDLYQQADRCQHNTGGRLPAIPGGLLLVFWPHGTAAPSQLPSSVLCFTCSGIRSLHSVSVQPSADSLGLNVQPSVPSVETCVAFPRCAASPQLSRLAPPRRRPVTRYRHFTRLSAPTCPLPPPHRLTIVEDKTNNGGGAVFSVTSLV